MATNYFPGNSANHIILPNEITGYAFDPQDSWWSVIVPEGSTNMIINPSFEAWTVTEYTATDWSAATYEEFETVHATAGKRLAKLTMGATEANLEYTEGLIVSASQPYSFSLDVYAPYIGSSVTLQIRNGVTILAQKSFTFRRVGWHRLSLSYFERSTGARQVRLVSTTANASGTIFYTDAWQFEAKTYATTYLDGDMIGNSDSIPNESYYWMGAAHRSMSVRRETTSSGGLVVSWSEEAEFRTTSIVGLGMSPVESIVEVMADGREVHRGTIQQARPFTITGRIFARDFPSLMEDHLALVRLLRPNNTDNGEQFVLRYQYINHDHIEGPALDIICAYNSGLEGSINGLYQETLAIQFRASQPSLASVFGSSAELLLYKELVTNNVIFKDEYGDYDNLGTGTTNAFPTRVGFLRNGSPVAFGPFAQLAGDAVDDSAYWDGTNWQQLGDLAGRSASDVIDGYVSGYPLTISTTIGDVVEYDEATDTWTDLGTGFTGTIHAIARDPAGNIWVAGEFAQDEAMLVTYNNVAKWNILTEAWETLGDGLTDPLTLNPTLEVFTVLADDDGYVYFGGWFEQGDSGAATTLANGAIRWNPVTEEWSAMGYGFNAAPNQFIRGSNGYIYAVGPFSQDGTTSYDLRGFARWNGYQWEEVFELVKLDGTYGADGITMDENGVFWFYNYVTDASQDLFDVPTLGAVGTFGWKDGVFYPSIGSVSITHMAIGPGNRTIYAVRAIDLEATYKVPAMNEVEYEGTADTYVALHIQGKCTPVQCINTSTRGGIYFRADLVIGENEEVVARSDTQRTLTYSHYRHNLKRFISSGPTNFRSLRLRPGINRISVFARNIETLTASAWLTWKNKYWGVQ